MTRLVLFTGKGGAGKTTAAAATARQAAGCGVATLLLSAGPGHSVADVLGVRLGPEPTEVAAGLFAGQLDPGRRAELAWPAMRGGLLAVLDDLGVEPLGAEELTELPAVDDVLTLLELRDRLADPRWDLVIVDCAGAVETLRLLAVPELLAGRLQRLLPMNRRIARLVGAPRRSGSIDALVEAADRFGALLGELVRLLHAPATSVRLVLTPESLALAETRRTWTALALYGLAVDAVLVNRLFPAGPDGAWRQAWLPAQAKLLAAVQTAFAPVPVLRCHYAATEPIGLTALAELAELIYGPAGPEAAAALLDPPPPVRTVDVRSEADGFVLRLPLPLAGREDLDLGRRGDDLVLTLEGRRRVLPLPSGLRRCQVTGAVLRDGELSISFVPDPAQWRSI